MSKITKSELKKQIKENNLKNLYFLFGDEKYLIEHYTGLIKEKILGNCNTSFNFKCFNSDTINTDDLESDIEDLPFMSEKRCILIKNLNIETMALKERKKLLSLISDVPPYCVLIFSFTSLNFSAKKSAKWKSFISEFEKYGCTVDFKKLSKNDLKKQLVLWAKSIGKELSYYNAEKIIDICSDDLLTLRNELQKLCCFSDSTEITESIISKVITRNTEVTVFELSNAVVMRDCDKSIKRLSALLYQKEDPIAILAVISSSFIDIYRAKVAIQSEKTLNDITNSFNYKGKEFKIKNATNDSRDYSLSDLEYILNLLLKTDIELKSTAVDKEILLQKLIVNICLTDDKLKELKT